ncbi:MAG TPA: M56 family metallopeptidase [Planctomycetaceae bacterium]|jgi:beta-lactamase regulating signal transducer with metallopeptidase domain|nr:M56 family metallopeptidase [Planctomycetaceae bacterium]
MTSLISQLPMTNAVEALGWTLLHFLWQGTAVAGLLWVLLRLTRNRAPEFRYLAGCAALAFMCAATVSTLVAEIRQANQRRSDSTERIAGTLPRVTESSLLVETFAAESIVATSTMARASTNIVTATGSMAKANSSTASQSGTFDSTMLTSLRQTAARLAQRVEPYLPWIVCLWALGVAVFSLRLLACWKTVRALRVAADATDSQWIGRFTRLKTRLGVSYAVRLVFSTSATVPMVIGWLKPVVLVPAGLVAGLSAAQLEAILAHELLHIRRHDYLVNLVQNVLETLFFYHPAVAWVSSRIRIEREHCCDDAAALVCGGTLDYARALAALAEERRASALSVAATGGSLVERIRRLATAAETDARLGMSSGAATLLSLTVSVVALAALGAALAQERIPAGRAREADRPAAMTPTRPTQPGPTASNEKSVEMISVRGQVLRPDGRPAAGAKVLALHGIFSARENSEPLATTLAGPGGEFAIRFPRKKRDDGLVVGVFLAAWAPGVGIEWTGMGRRRPDSTEPVVLKLVPEVPVHGRIVDLEGRPLRDVRVKVLRQMSTKTSAYPVSTFDDESQPPVRTDRDGRFVLGGIGADRGALLEIRGETIAYAQFSIDTRTSRAAPLEPGMSETVRVFGTNFTFEAAPTKPIEGTVRDADTGQPLAGVAIVSEAMAGMRVKPFDVVRTVTDAQGRYRLVGLPKVLEPDQRNHNEIAAVPNAEQPYFIQSFNVPDTPGFVPVTHDFQLKRGVWVTGRVTNKLTGKPIPASVTYSPFRSNPNATNRPEFVRRQFLHYQYGDCVTRADGSFRLVGLPGRGIVTAGALLWAARTSPHALNGTYVRGVGAAEIAGMTKDGSFPTYGPYATSAKRANALKEINPTPATQAVVCNLAFDPGGTMQIHTVDGKGNPIGTCSVAEGLVGQGLTVGGSRESTFDLTGLAPHESRTLMIWQTDKKIGKALKLSYDEKSPRSLTVTLEPCATVKGRLVDEDGLPVTDLSIGTEEHQGTDFPSLLRRFKCDAHGRFVDVELLPGCDSYSLQVSGRNLAMPDKIAVVAGKTIDLGDVKVMRRRME